MPRLLSLVLLVSLCPLEAGCGRIGYDPLAELDAAVVDIDADSTVSAIVSVTKLTPGGTFSYVDLDIDWQAKRAFAASRKSGECVTAIDFSDELNPVVIGEVAPTRTGSACLGVRRFGNGRLLVSSESPGSIDLHEATPPFALVDSVSVAQPRRFGIDGTEVVVAQRRDITRLTVTDSSVSAGASYTGPCLRNHVTPVNGVLITACWQGAPPLLLLDPATMLEVRQHDMVPPDAADGGFWTGVASADGSLVFQGGWIGAFLVRDANNYDVAYRFDGAQTYRQGVFEVENGVPILYAVAAGGDSYLEQWNLSDPSAPLMLTRTLLEGTEREGYGLKIDLASRRALLVTNYGDFVVIDLDKLTPTTEVWPSF